jgi:hypothetical protein
VKTLIILMLALNIFFICKYLSFAITKWYVFSLRDSICIERLRKEQKCGDIIIATYNSTVTLICIWVSVLLFCSTKSPQLSPIVLNTTTGILVGVLFSLSIMQYVLIKKYSLDTLYNTIVDYRSRQKVVTEDNDYEVQYIRTFREILKEERYVIAWAIYMLGVHAYYYYTVYL